MRFRASSSFRAAMMAFNSRGAEKRFPPGSSPAASIAPPVSSFSRQRPMASKFSRPKPIGSRVLWQFAHTAPGLIALGLVFCSLTAAWLCGYALAVARAGDVLRRRLRRLLDAFTGCVLVALGLRLAAER